MQFEISPWLMGKSMEVKAFSDFEGKWDLNGDAPFKVNGRMAYKEPFAIQLRAEVQEFDLKTLNSIVETNVFAKIKNGSVKNGLFEMELNDKESNGTITLIYNDLEIELLDEQTLERGRGKKHILTFVINNLALKKNNPRKWSNKTHQGVIHYQRDETRFVFNYIWNATLTGIKETLGFKNRESKLLKKENNKKNKI